MLSKKLHMKHYFLLVILFTRMLCNAQEMPSFTPPSPEASGLGSYGQVPVGMFTGTLQHSIPLFEVSQSNFKLPITLSYSSNGINVDKYASVVGMEWALNTGGVITRMLNDQEDEYYRVNLPDYVMGSDEMNDFLSNVMTGNIDTQPDLYSFNVNGFSGKFYFDQNWNPTQISPTPVKIEKLVNTTGNENELDFKLTTPDGVQYWFGGVNASEHSFSRSDDMGAGGFSAPSDVLDVAWYVSKIVLLNGEEILFQYLNNNFNYDSGISQVVSASYNSQPGSAPVYTSAQQRHPVINKSYSSISNISSITWGQGRLDFHYANRGTGNTLLKLNNIKLYDNNDTLIKGYHLNYFTALSDPTHTNIGAETNSSRLFLKELIPFDKNLVEDNKFTFDYYNTNELPPRLTYSRDYWGYFNGADNDYLVPNDVSYYTPTDYAEPPFNYSEVQYLFRNVGGDRKANGAFGVKGLLKKITYPTNGFNSFIYEPHTQYKGSHQYTNSLSESTSIQTIEDQYGTHSSNVIINNVPEQEVTIYPYVDRVFNCGGLGDPSHHTKATFYVYDITDNNNIFPIDFYFNPAYGGIPSTHGPSLIIDDDFLNTNPYFVKLEEGHDYEFKVVINRPCLNAGFSFNYFGNKQFVYQNEEVGGVRIKSIISNDGNTSYSEDYQYADLGSLNQSSGVTEQIKPGLSFSKSSSFFNGGPLGSPNDGTTINQGVALSSSSLTSLYFSQSYHIAYSSVVKSFNEGMNKGASQYNYNIAFDALPIIGSSSTLVGTPRTNSFGTGELLSEKHYKQTANGLKLIQEKINSYHTDTNLQNEIQGYTVGYDGFYNFTAVLYDFSTQGTTTYYDVNKYYVKSKWRYLDQTIEKQYDLNGLNPIETTTNYFYDNPDHLQVTRTEVLNSEGNLTKTKMQYPEDITSVVALTYDNLTTDELNAINLLKAPTNINPNRQNRVTTPIQTETIIEDINGNLLSKSVQRTNYKIESNLVLPFDIQVLKGTYSTTNTLENRIQYHKYDQDTGKPLEISKTDDVHVVYIWGYQNQFPIAKIENATYSQVQEFVSNLQSLSNADNDRTLNYDGKEGLLRQALDNLRNQLPNAMVSTYTYDPLIGVTSMTDPRGYTMYYEYDDFNRLLYIKDKAGNILSENEYNYGN